MRKAINIEWRRQYDPEVDRAIQIATATGDLGPSLTIQSYTDAVNINTMVKKMGITDGSTLPGPSVTDPTWYGNFDDALTLRDVFERVDEAERRFRTLPADIRAHFNHNPAALLDFVQNPANHEKAVELGLLSKNAPAKPAEATITPAKEAGVT